MNALATALLAELDDQALDSLAARLAPRVISRLEAREVDPWLNVEAAAEYLACPRSRVYALVSARRIPHQKDGSRLLFKRSELDAWVISGGAVRP